MTAIVDTSFLLAMANSKDRNHTQVLNIARSINDPLILPVPVLPEVCYLIASRLGHKAMRLFLKKLVASDTMLEAITSSDLQRVTEILDK